ncbi:MAG: cupin domain-containing protein [Bacteroidota bacterium]
MSIVSKDTCSSHYQWGDGCDGWVLADTKDLSVKQERMPPQTTETLHFHNRAQQFFFILKGTATFEVEDKTFVVESGQGFHIAAGKKHRVINNAAGDIEFILSSQPSTNNDRINCI